jgi:hypothetical protein
MHPIHLDTAEIVACIAATASVSGAIFAGIVALWTARRERLAASQLENQKARLSNQLAEENAHRLQAAAERDARRDYEYEAKKRLYGEIEPLLFQLYEALQEAHYRVRSLARSSRLGNLPDWLEPNSYYLHSSAYKLILPAVYLRLIQREMTFVDLRVDESIRTRYSLMKFYSRSFTDDFEFAKYTPSLEYRPNDSDKPRDTRQGLVLGTLENICDTMIVKRSEDGSRAMSYAEFEDALAIGTPSCLAELTSLLTNFSPLKRPILSRILIAQAVMAQLIASTYEGKTAVTELPTRLGEILKLYRSNRVLAWDQTDTLGSTEISEAYLLKRFKWMLAGDQWIENDG